MSTPLPPTLSRKLRSFRFAYWSIAIAETICLGASLITLINPAWLPLALLWLGWKVFQRPTNRAIAAAVEARHPDLKEKVVAAVELAESADPPSVRGSSEMMQQLLEEVDRRIASVDIAR